MASILNELELCAIGRLSRGELVEAIRACQRDLPPDLLQGLERQPTWRLQLLLLAGRTLEILRQLQEEGG